MLDEEAQEKPGRVVGASEPALIRHRDLRDRAGARVRRESCSVHGQVRSQTRPARTVGTGRGKAHQLLDGARRMRVLLRARDALVCADDVLHDCRACAAQGRARHRMAMAVRRRGTQADSGTDALARPPSSARRAAWVLWRAVAAGQRASARGQPVACTIRRLPGAAQLVWSGLCARRRAAVALVRAHASACVCRRRACAPDTRRLWWLVWAGTLRCADQKAAHGLSYQSIVVVGASRA